MKTIIIAFVVLLNIVLIAQSSNLAEKLADYNLQLVNKISIGSSPDEVKKILGKPSVVEAGFPDSDETLFFDEFPSDQAGQSNYTTWFYRLSKKKITYTVYADTKFFINGEEVTSDLYNYYLDKDSVYYQAVCSINNEKISLDLYNYYLDKDSVYLNSHSEIDFPPTKETQKSFGHDARDNKKGRLFIKKESPEMKLDELVVSTLFIRRYKKDYVLVKKASQEMKIDKQHNTSDTFLPILCIVFEKGTNVVALSKVYFQWL